MPKSFLPVLLAAIVLAGCSTNNVTVDDSLKTYFDSAGVRGDFGLYDNQHGHFTIYNLGRFRDSAFTPGATFDIIGALIALQTGLVTNDTSILYREVRSLSDGYTKEELRSMERDTSWKKGTPVSLRDVLQEDKSYSGSAMLARNIGKDSLKKWVDSLHYGNRDLSGFDSMMISSHLRITSDEQLGLIKKLYFDQLPFFQRTQKITRSLFLTEQNSNYKLTYKTGSWTEDGKTVAWILGWEEENKQPYFFVLNFETNDRSLDAPAVGLQLVKKILAPMGFFAGKK